MCGIVGAVSTPQHRPHPGRRPEAPRIPRLRLLRRGRAPGRRAAARAQHRARGRTGRQRGRATASHAGTGIAHTRWATHGAPDGAQRAPALLAASAPKPAHRAGAQRHHREPRRAARRAAGQRATSSTARPTPRSSPTWSTTCTTATCSTPCSAPCSGCSGAYAIAVFCRDEPQRVVGAREGSPLIAGRRRGRELPGLRRDGAGRRDRPDRLPRRRRRGRPAAGQDLDRRAPGRRPLQAPCSARCAPCSAHSGAAELGPYRHYMQKEIFEQPRAIADTLEAVARHQRPSCSATAPTSVFKDVDQVLILACGTSYYAGSTAKYWLEVDRRHPDQRRDRQRIPLPRQRAQPEARWSSPSRRAAKPPTRWPR